MINLQLFLFLWWILTYAFANWHRWLCNRVMGCDGWRWWCDSMDFSDKNSLVLVRSVDFWHCHNHVHERITHNHICLVAIILIERARVHSYANCELKIQARLGKWQKWFLFSRGPRAKSKSKNRSSISKLIISWHELNGSTEFKETNSNTNNLKCFNIEIWDASI